MVEGRTDSKHCPLASSCAHWPTQIQYIFSHNTHIHSQVHGYTHTDTHRHPKTQTNKQRNRVTSVVSTGNMPNWGIENNS